MARWLFVLAFFLVGLVATARADTGNGREPPATPTEWVTDNAGFLQESTRASLSASGHQVLVWIGETTGDVPLEDFTVRAFEKWKVGRKGIDDGVALFVFTKDRKARIEVGYGLEDKIPDAAAGRIIQETLIPRIRAGDPDGAISSGVEAIVARLDGKLGPGRERAIERPTPTLTTVQAIFLALGLIALIAFLATHPSLAALLLMSFFSGGRGGGGGWGGGRSGGGGASGSW